MSDSEHSLTFYNLLFSVIEYEIKIGHGSLQRDFRGDLSFEELIDSAVSKLQKWSKLDEFLKSIDKTVRPKDDNSAEALRKEGNSHYMKSNFKLALKKFNESIKFSSHPSMEDVSENKPNSCHQNLPFAYANRAAVLIEMGLYDEACTDIRRAVKLGYTRQKQKLCVRYCKSLVYIHLKNNPQLPIASSVFDDVFKQSEADIGCTLDDEQKKQIRELIFDVKKTVINQRKSIVVSKPALDGEHPNILGLSNKVEFAAKVKRGRYLIAGKDIYPGALLAVDPGFTAPTLLPQYVGEYCSACSKPCELICIPCQQCSSAVFCNEECRDEAIKSYHRYECSVLPLFDTLKLGTESYLTLRIIASLGYSELHKSIKLFEEEERAKKPSMAKRGFSSSGTYDPKSYRSVYYLTDHKEKRDSKDLCLKSCLAVVMTFIVKKYTTFFDAKDISSEQSVVNVLLNEREMLIAKLILRHLMSMTVNATSNTFCEVSSGLGSWDEKTIGGNLQCLLSLIGHSCNPNAVILDSCTLRSLAIIPKGTEICIAYILSYTLASKGYRQATLKNVYYFTCDCIACVEDWQSNEGTTIDVPSYLRFKCNFGCENETLNIYKQKCTKCSESLNQKKPLYSKSYLKHTSRIIYGFSSDNSKSIERDMALTTEDLFSEIVPLVQSIFFFDWSRMSSNSSTEARKVAYNASKGIYLFDTYGECPKNYLKGAMRESLQKFLCRSSKLGTLY